MNEFNRIIIRDYDSTYQAKLWIESVEKDQIEENFLNKNNLKVQETMKAILRTILLLAGELTFFYSEIFDGIFFLEWGPDEVAKTLGYSINDKLPIKIYGPTDQFYDLKAFADGLKNSSKLAKCYVNPENSLNKWMYGERTIINGAIDNIEYEEWYEEKSIKWIEAIKEGRIELLSWSTDLANVKKDFAFKEMMEESVSKLDNLPIQISTLINMILNLPDDKRTSNVECIGFAKNIKAGVEDEFFNKCNQKEIAITGDQIEDKRAKVLYFIDHVSEDSATKYLVYWWWNQQYMKTIANKYYASYVIFNSDEWNKLPANTEYDLEDIAIKLGLKHKKVSKWKILLQNFNISIKNRNSLVISGNILEDIMDLTPSSFLQLQKNIKRAFPHNSKINGSKIYDISLIISDVLNVSQTYRDRLRGAFKKLMFVTVSSSILLLYDAQVLKKQGLYLYIWLVILLIVSIPWSELHDMIKLRKSNLSASITLYEE